MTLLSYSDDLADANFDAHIADNSFLPNEHHRRCDGEQFADHGSGDVPVSDR